jgi:hypothetical protein
MKWIRCDYCGIVHPEGEDCQAFRRDFADWLKEEGHLKPELEDKHAERRKD